LANASLKTIFVKNHRAARRPLPKRSTVAIALALSLGVLSADAVAFGLGEPEITSTLGQPLRMRVPLQPDPAVDLSPQCLRLLGNPRDPVPTLTQARLTVEQVGKQSFLRIDSVAPVDEPILRVTVDAGCAQHVQREFIVLLDPPAAPNASAPLSPALASLNASGGYNIAPPNATIAEQVGVTPELDLGVARVEGHLGQPLSMQIPVLGSAAATIDNASVRTARLLGSDGAPLRNRTQVGLARTDSGTFLQLITADAVTDPAVRVEIEVATATASVRREYGVLLDPVTPAPKPAAEPASAPFPADTAPQAAPAEEAKAAAESAPPAAAAAPPPKPHKPRLHRLPKAPTTIPAAPSNGSAASAEAAHAPGASDAKGAAAPATAANPAKSAGPDRLVLSAPDDQAEAAAKRFSDMDQRVKDLTQEIVRLRSDLATQKAHEAELVAESSRPGGSWILATIGALGLGLGLFVLWMRRRGSGSWNPASWEQVTNHYVEPGENAGADTRLRPEGAPTRSAPSAASPAEVRPAARPAVAPAPRRASNTVNAEPLTILPMTAPIEVTEVLGNEPSIEQLYTLFYDVGGNTSPGGPLGKPPQPSSVLPAVDVPKHDSLDLDLGIPDSIQSAREARAQTALKASAGAAKPGAAPRGPSFTYEEPAAAKPAPPSLDMATNVGPVTEMPRDGEFAQTQPDLDLDLTTNVGGVTQIGPLTEMPRDETPAPAGAAGPRKPMGLDLDLNTNIGGITQVGPLTEIPRDHEDPTTQVEVDLDLNTNVQALGGEGQGMERESGPIAITTIPMNRAKSR
jgi:hypothetical protein